MMFDYGSQSWQVLGFYGGSTGMLRQAQHDMGGLVQRFDGVIGGRLG